MLGYFSRLEGLYPQMSIKPVRRRALPLKNTAFLHFSIFAASHFDMRNKPCKAQWFLYLTHTRYTVNYRGISDPEVGRK